MAVIRIGTRGSALARWQAEWVQAELQKAGCEVELVFISTQGDVATGPLGQIGGQGLFTKEIQRALLANVVDIAVHSLKDLPTEPVPGLTLAVVPQRESPGDVFVSLKYPTLDSLPPGATLGTGSLRRRAQLLHWRPDLQIADIRGNVDTRLRRLEEGAYDAIVLAEAGLNRLGFSQRIRQIIPPEIMLPAVGQGALGIETRSNDEATIASVHVIDHLATRRAVVAERSLLAGLRGGCLAPIGALAECHEESLTLRGCVLDASGARKIAVHRTGPAAQAFEIGEEVASELQKLGADELISSSRLPQ